VNARQLDEAARELHDLRTQSVEDLALALVATGLALAATQVRPVLAMPLLLGAIGVGFLGVRTLVRRMFLVEELAGDRDAYEIPAVLRFGLRTATPAHRRQLARSIWVAMTDSTYPVAERLRSVRVELEQLVAVLEDERRSLQPYTLVMLERWLNDPGGEFRNRAVPTAELRSRLRAILAQIEADESSRR
jgi:hypothetical protein